MNSLNVGHNPLVYVAVLQRPDRTLHGVLAPLLQPVGGFGHHLWVAPGYREQGLA